MATQITENELIINNMGLVKKIAKMFRPPNKTEYEEYVQVGRIGLMKAIRKHIPEKGMLSTIAWTHIKWEIMRYIKKNHGIGERLTSDIPIEKSSTSDFQHLIPDYLSDIEKRILSLKLEGHKLADIAKIIGMERYYLIKNYKSLVKKIKAANE